MSKKRKALSIDEPLRHPDHSRPVTRREFLAQGFTTGLGVVAVPSTLALLTHAQTASAALSSDLQGALTACVGSGPVGGGIPFICFDLAGGANIAGSNVMVGSQGGQGDVLTTEAYRKLGVRPDRAPTNPQVPDDTIVDRDSLGLWFHRDSAMLAGILERFPTPSNVNGAVIPARSENDTGNNPHNPMYGIARAGGDGSVLTLIGSRNSDSGGNSMAPDELMDPERRPTKIDRPSDAAGLVDASGSPLFAQSDSVAIMESLARISDRKLAKALAQDAELRQRVNCGYLESASVMDRFGGSNPLDPASDTDIVADAGGIFTPGELNGGGRQAREFAKTAAVMKLVIDNEVGSTVSYAGAGTIAMGGYDYHTGDRVTGEARDLLAGRCIGACLEYARRKNKPLMIYVCSDGSVASNGREDPMDPQNKPEWTGDNSSTAASFFLVYNPNSQPVLKGATDPERAQHQQLGWFRRDGSVDTSSSPAANNVNLLVRMVVANYLGLLGLQGELETRLNLSPHGLGADLDRWIAFEPLT